MDITNTSEKILTIIIPFRISENRTDIRERILHINMDEKFPKEFIDVIFVDDNSENNDELQEIINTIEKNDFKYVKVPTFNKNINMSKARNIGVKNADTEFIMIQDLDLMPYEGFYENVLEEIIIQDLENNHNKFIMFPCIYLTEEGNHVFEKMNNKLKRNFFIQKAIIEKDEYLIEKVSSGTSITVFNKSYYNKLGGYDESFENWGNEDIDFNMRAILDNCLFEAPINIDMDKRNFINIYEYKGWKSLYRLYGDSTAVKGLYMFHNWHIVNGNSKYQSQRLQNKEKFTGKLIKYIKNISFSKKTITKNSMIFDRYKYAENNNTQIKKTFILKFRIKKFFNIK
jgi:predicted glycosyltransferase involved in capsule biosynthesis